MDIRDSPASHVAKGTSVNFRTIKMEVLYLYFGGTFPKIGADIGFIYARYLHLGI